MVGSPFLLDWQDKTVATNKIKSKHWWVGNLRDAYSERRIFVTLLFSPAPAPLDTAKGGPPSVVC